MLLRCDWMNLSFLTQIWYHTMFFVSYFAKLYFNTSWHFNVGSQSLTMTTISLILLSVYIFLLVMLSSIIFWYKVPYICDNWIQYNFLAKCQWCSGGGDDQFILKQEWILVNFLAVLWENRCMHLKQLNILRFARMTLDGLPNFFFSVVLYNNIWNNMVYRNFRPRVLPGDLHSALC